MAGEVKSQLTITLAGGVGPAGGGGSATAPVARRPDLMSPGQSLSTYAAERQMRWSRVMAMEAARDKQTMQEIHAGLEKLEVQRALEVSSARRAARENFAAAVRNSRGAAALEAGMLASAGARAQRQLGTSAKKMFKSSLKAGIGISLTGLLPDLLPDSPGSRIAQSVGAGAIIGSVIPGVGTGAGAVVGLIQATISEVQGYIKDLYAMGQKLKDEIDERIQETKSLFKQVNKLVEEIESDLKAELEKTRLDAAIEINRNTYRATRYVYANLTGDHD